MTTTITCVDVYIDVMWCAVATLKTWYQLHVSSDFARPFYYCLIVWQKNRKMNHFQFSFIAKNKFEFYRKFINSSICKLKLYNYMHTLIDKCLKVSGIFPFIFFFVFGWKNFNRLHKLENIEEPYNIIHTSHLLQCKHWRCQHKHIHTPTHTNAHSQQFTHTHNQVEKLQWHSTAILYSAVYYVQMKFFENDSLVIRTHIVFTFAQFFFQFYCPLVAYLSLSIFHSLSLVSH